MSVFVIADTHLSENLPKPMDIFGYRWENWTEKLISEWQKNVKADDTVVIPGDVSWGISFEESKADFALLDSLPGKKLLGKGNHDYWFSTMNKAEAFFKKENFSTLSILFNNAYLADGIKIVGCRGWFTDEKSSPKTAEYDKIVARETGRLRLSLEAAKKLGESERTACFFHFPPVYAQFVCREMIDVLHEYGINECYYGHIHGKYDVPAVTEYEEISFRLVSADFLDFRPFCITDAANN